MRSYRLIIPLPTPKGVGAARALSPSRYGVGVHLHGAPNLWFAAASLGKLQSFGGRTTYKRNCYR